MYINGYGMVCDGRIVAELRNSLQLMWAIFHHRRMYARGNALTPAVDTTTFCGNWKILLFLSLYQNQMSFGLV